MSYLIKSGSKKGPVSMKKSGNFKKYKKTSGLMLILLAFVVILVMFASSCSKPFFLPGISLGYFIWEDESGKINIMWSSDRKKVDFTGFLSTDGIFDDIKKLAFEEDDEIIILPETISFNCSLDGNDFSDGISFLCKDYSYIEISLKIDGNTDLNRINLGKFLNSPQEENFRITPNYFKELKTVPWFKNHPFAEFFKKLYSGRHLTFLYILLLGIVVIELMRITKYRTSKKKLLFLTVSYVLLVMLDCIFLIFLWYINGH